jgi:hypothetical protein
VAALGSLADHMVFVGGCATGLLITDTAAPPIRATQDVDVITEVASLSAYHRLSKQLRKRGFKEDQSPDAPICRWITEGVVLDVMPTNSEILGFGNEWYRPALETAELVALSSGSRIRMVTAPYFLATKLEAFYGRGKGDYAASHDMEDIITVLDGRQSVIDEVKRSNEKLRKYLAAKFSGLLSDRYFSESLSGHLPGDAASQARISFVVNRIESLANIN